MRTALTITAGSLLLMSYLLAVSRKFITPLVKVDKADYKLIDIASLAIRENMYCKNGYFAMITLCKVKRVFARLPNKSEYMFIIVKFIQCLFLLNIMRSVYQLLKFHLLAV